MEQEHLYDRNTGALPAQSDPNERIARTDGFEGMPVAVRLPNELKRKRPPNGGIHPVTSMTEFADVFERGCW